MISLPLDLYPPGRVVITGGAGFIGVSLARKLRLAGIPVAIFDRPDRLARLNHDIDGIECFHYNLSDGSGNDKFTSEDTLIHLASSTLPATSMRSFVYDAESNIVGSLRTFEAAINQGVRKIIFSSSGGAVYGTTSNVAIVESHSTRPLSAYGVSKLSIERYLSIYSSDVPAISLRIGNPYGPLQYRGAGVGAIARYLVAAQREEPLPVWGDGTIVRDYLYIDDLTEALCSAIRKDIPSGEYNIGSNTGHSISQIIDAIRRVTGKGIRVEYSNGRSFDPPSIILECSKFRSATDWCPAIGLDAGISKMWTYLIKSEVRTLAAA